MIPQLGYSGLTPLLLCFVLTYKCSYVLCNWRNVYLQKLKWPLDMLQELQIIISVRILWSRIVVFLSENCQFEHTTWQN